MGSRYESSVPVTNVTSQPEEHAGSATRPWICGLCVEVTQSVSRSLLPANLPLFSRQLQLPISLGVDYAHGRRAHTWAKDAGFEVVHVDAYHPHYRTGEHKGF